MFGERFFQPLGLFHTALFGQALADAIKRIGKPLWLDRLHQIVCRLRFKGPDRMVAIGRHEDEQRRFYLHQALHHGKAIKAGHLNIKKDQIGLVRFDGSDRFPAVLASIDNFNIGMRL